MKRRGFLKLLSVIPFVSVGLYSDDVEVTEIPNYTDNIRTNMDGCWVNNIMTHKEQLSRHDLEILNSDPLLILGEQMRSKLDQDIINTMRVPKEFLNG